MKTVLDVRLFGGLGLNWCGSQLGTVHSPRLQSLLAYLILHREAPPSRQHLAFLLFPDSPEAQARTNLRNLFHLLRHALPRADDFLYSDAQCLQWKSDAPFSLDVNEFEKIICRAQELPDWQRAIELYQGDLLPECYDDWILPERERLRLVYLNALEQACALCEKARDSLGARNYAQQLLNGDPLREESYRRLMQLAALNGDRAGVVRFYNQCVNVLARELDVEPGAETNAAYRQYSQLAAQARVDTPVAPDGKQLDNLPLQLTSFVGRAEDVASLCAVVIDKRLVTCTGAGGVGKTRLALAAAEALRAQFANGVWWVNLASLTSDTLVMQAIASALDVRETPNLTLEDNVTNFLREKHLLLVLDNCEHLIDAARRAAEQFLQAAPQLHLLVTSRRVLHSAGEAVWRVPPLSVPPMREHESMGALLQYAAVQLFVERAQSAFASFVLSNENADVVAQICQRLDGIPLALELAAARVNLLDAREIAARLGDAFHLLTHGKRNALPHHQTLRATMDWSHDTLSPQERVLFRRLSVFAGGFTVDAAETVCADVQDPSAENAIAKTEILDLLSNLMDKSLVMASTQDHKPRMRLLEPVREYAREKLMACGEEKVLHERHFDYFLDLARQADERIPTGDQKEWLMRLELEHSNLRAALERSRTQTNQERGLELAAALVRFWARRGYFAEGQYWLDLQLTKVHAPAQIRAKAFSGLGTFKYMQGHYADAATLHTQALALYQEADDTKGIIDSLRDLGVQLLKQTEYTQAQDLFEQSLALARKNGNMFGIQRALHGLGACALNQLEPARAQRLLEEALEVAQQGQDKREILYICFQLGAATAANEGLASSAKWCQTAMELARELGDRWGEASALIGMCGVRQDGGDLAEASAFGKQALRASAEIDSDSKIVDCFEVMANLATAQGNAQRAAHLFGAGQTLRQAIGFPIEKMDIALYEKSIAAVRAQLDENTFAKAWAEGRAMSKEQAIAYALQDD